MPEEELHGNMMMKCMNTGFCSSGLNDNEPYLGSNVLRDPIHVKGAGSLQRCRVWSGPQQVLVTTILNQYFFLDCGDSLAPTVRGGACVT